MRSKLPSAACALSLALTSCASRSREVATPAPAVTASAASAPALTSRRPETPEPPGQLVVPRDADPKQMREHVGHLFELVATLARERDWAPAPAAAAGALRVLADAVDVAPAALDRAIVASLAADVRSAAARLASTGYPSLERSDLARAGLLAAIRALDQLAAPLEGSLLARLLANAHDAARAIDVSSPFSFERARIQDAFRATADAFLVFADGAGRAPIPVIGRR